MSGQMLWNLAYEVNVTDVIITYVMSWLCQIFSQSVKGLQSSDTPKLLLPSDLLWRPYSVRTQYCATLNFVMWNSRFSGRSHIVSATGIVFVLVVKKIVERLNPGNVHMLLTWYLILDWWWAEKNRSLNAHILPVSVQTILEDVDWPSINNFLCEFVPMSDYSVAEEILSGVQTASVDC